ncbi:hypothetical protein B6V76_17345 [Thioclava sp. IC9]|nr:hypothetical protein B6V76_17345 [Thioclava sp. IC9]
MTPAASPANFRVARSVAIIAGDGQGLIHQKLTFLEDNFGMSTFAPPPSAVSFLHRLRGYRGALERLENGRVIGWLAKTGDSASLDFEIHCNAGRLGSGRAAMFRADLVQAGIGAGNHGFALPLSPALKDAAGGAISLHLPGGGPIASLRFDPDAAPCPKERDALRRHMLGPIVTLRSAGTERARTPHLSAQHPLFTSRAGEEALPAPLFSYIDYARHHAGMAKQLPLDGSDRAVSNILRWYLESHAAQHPAQQIPLNRVAIDWLNTEIHPGGPSRAMHILGKTGDDRDTATAWALRGAPSLGVADCLLPDSLIESLSQSETPGPWPMTRGLLALREAIPPLAQFSPKIERHRRMLHVLAMILAAERPEILLFLRRSETKMLLEGGRLSDVCARLHPGPPITRAHYAAALRENGFDLDSMAFLRAPGGHRLAAATRPAPKGVPVDVQVLGPFAKASGLGQSTRLSHDILSRCDVTLNAVESARDNPTPAQGGAKTAVSRPARINLLHLNADAIPPAFSFDADCYSDAYNIAYMHWELTRAPACHRLALDLIDEVWVPSEYCAEIYRKATDKPVVNVGMCYPEPPAIDRGHARSALRRRNDWPEQCFVCLASFDSFSFVQRKNPLGTIHAFRAAFAEDAEVRLLIKTQNRGRICDPAQAMLWSEIERLLAADPRISLLDETLDHAEVLELMTGADLYVSLHRSEGWGFGMLEAMVLGVPVLCTGYSGNLEFCNEETAWLVPATEVEVAPQDYLYVEPGMLWGEPDHAAAVAQLQAARSHPDARKKKAAQAEAFVRRHFSADAIAARYSDRLSEIFIRLDGAHKPLARPAE